MTADATDRVLSIDRLARLLAVLRDDGHQLVGPTVRGRAIVHAEIRGVEDLPVGWTETQEAGRYRLARRRALFGYAVGPQSWKQHFFVPRLRLFLRRPASAPRRYRQWLVHQLASWLDQFGTSGCVGCGRCIPVGIDLTEEAAAIRATDGTQP